MSGDVTAPRASKSRRTDERYQWRKFNPAALLADANVAACSLAAQGLWARVWAQACVMEEPGFLRVAGEPMSKAAICLKVGVDPAVGVPLLEELGARRVYSVAGDGAIFCRRIAREEQRSRTNQENGEKGGNPALREVRITEPRAKSDNRKRARSTANGTADAHPETAANTDADTDIRGGTPTDGPENAGRITETRAQSDKAIRARSEIRDQRFTPSETSSPQSCARTRNRKPRAEQGAHPEHAEVIRFHGDLYQRAYGEPYPFQGGKDGEAVSWMLRQAKGDAGRVKAKIERAFADEYRRTNGMLTLTKLRAAWGELVEPRPGLFTAPTRAADLERRLAESAARPDFLGANGRA